MVDVNVRIFLLFLSSCEIKRGSAVLDVGNVVLPKNQMGPQTHDNKVQVTTQLGYSNGSAARTCKPSVCKLRRFHDSFIGIASAIAIRGTI